MAVPKKRKSISARKLRRNGLYRKMKLPNINNIKLCNRCNKPTLSHKYHLKCL